MIITKQWTVDEYREKHLSSVSDVGDLKLKGTWATHNQHIDGIEFTHRNHAEKYQELAKWLATGVITDLILLPNIEVLPKFDGHKQVTYQPMFMYTDAEKGDAYIADRVGSNFYFWNLKYTLFEYFYPDVKVVPYGDYIYKL